MTNLFSGDPDTFIPPSDVWSRVRYTLTAEQVENEPGAWNSTEVIVHRDGSDRPVGTYLRWYPGPGPFEPFRQDGREFALVSLDYTRAAVLDLSSGDLAAEEAHPRGPDGEELAGAGFCPVEFYVPDWTDVHDGSILPGDRFWDEDLTWPSGRFGFVAGCFWGDDSSWKVQFLDLSRITDGVITRDDRFGYLPLASGVRLADAVSLDTETRSVSIATDVRFDLESGELTSYTGLLLDGLSRPRIPGVDSSDSR
jgi:hypothetical protein